uniref:Peptidase A1 domain-containing protein n=1 Tax=Leersia perrieri TaxID=77586 RepID=A0A0D9WZT3_9ORYZ
MAPIRVIAALVLATALAVSVGVDAASGGVRVGLTRVHSTPGVTASQFVRDALRRDTHRRARFLASSPSPSVSAPTRKDLPNGGEYIMTLSIGTPPLSYPAIADTGSDLVWTQCAPCGDQCFKQPGKLYNPSSSPTFRVLPCNSSLNLCAAALAGRAAPPLSGCACRYNQTYGTGWTAGLQAMETFTFGASPSNQVRVAGVAFGCSNASSDDWNGSAGLVGLGRGSLSLVSQLAAGMFSYCLTPFQDTDSKSTLIIGASAAINDTGVQSTPFVPSPSRQPMSTYYYLNLTGISVGSTPLSIPPNAFSLRADGTGGLIIDSGTTITSLPDAAYKSVRAAVASLVKLPVSADGSNATGLDLCFALPSSSSSAAAAPPANTLPSMTLHFGGGADMVLPVENYMIVDGGVWCLAMRGQADGELSTLGNYQQQNLRILYDVSPLLCLLLVLPCVAISSTPNRGVRLELTHVDDRGGYTGAERVRRAADRTHRRVNGLLAAVDDPSSTARTRSDGAAAAATVHASTATYLVDIAIGTPPVSLTAVLDTGSDLIWTQCDAPCRRCFPQPAPLYAPARSATYANVSCLSPMCRPLQTPWSRCPAAPPDDTGCPYSFSYGDGTSTDGVLATDTFTLAADTAVLPGVAFGCGTDNRGSTDNSSGLVGMGRGPLSLVSQLGVTRFSYCFTPFNSTATSPLFLGSTARDSSSAAKSTPFVANPRGGAGAAWRKSSYYYLSLEGITVGETLLPIDPSVFRLTATGDGGVIIDSGTTFTALEERAFVAVARAFAARVGLPLASGGARLGLGLCFAAAAPERVEVPRLVLHFDGADMELRRESYVVEDRIAGVVCLGMVSSRGMSVLGSMQQQNMHVLYDLEQGVLSFEPANCGEL